MNQPGESSISLGAITDRAEKLEVAQKETPQVEAEKTPVTGPEQGNPPEAAAPVSAEKKAEPVAEKKAPNDPDEMRKWNTRVSMENKAVKEELTAVRKQLEDLAAALSKSTKKTVDWKELAKDPAKLQSAIEEQQKQIEDTWQKKYEQASFESTSRITKLENQRRFHDPEYPRWAELNPVIVNLAATADSRIDFNKDPNHVLDQMYELAQEIAAKDPQFKPASAAATKTFTEAELEARVQERVAKAVEEAQKGLKAEQNGAGVAGMGKGAPKGKGGVDKQALWSMPLSDLKFAVQKASE